MARYGLIGKDIDYSFSRTYFAAKFQKEQLPHTYENFDCKCREELLVCLSDSSVEGFNVTIPYKETIIDMLDTLDVHSRKIGAVNTIKRLKDGSLKGYNTDWIGFGNSLDEICVSAFAKSNLIDDQASEEHINEVKKSQLPFKRALILGTGGASKAIEYALTKRGVATQYVSRIATNEYISYQDIDQLVLDAHKLVVNCTPLGTYPEVNLFPEIPYNLLSSNHIVFDLIYNPAETSFLKKAKAQGSFISNGLRMLELQANASWDLWQEG